MSTEVATKSHLADAVSLIRADLKESVGSLRAELKQNVTELKSNLRESELRLDVKIAEVKAGTLKWFVGMVGFQTLAVLGAVIILSCALH